MLAEQLGARDLAMVSFSMQYVETVSMKCVCHFKDICVLVCVGVGVSQDVHFRAVQLGDEQLAETARQTAEQLALRDQLEGQF